MVQLLGLESTMRRGGWSPEGGSVKGCGVMVKNESRPLCVYLNNTAGGNRSADPVRITDRNNGTYVVGIGSSDAPETEHQSCAGKSAPAEENPAGRRPMPQRRR